MAIQKPKRILRKAKTSYIYWLENSNLIYYKQSEGGIVYTPIAGYDQMPKWFNLFCAGILSDEQVAFLKRNNYELIGSV